MNRPAIAALSIAWTLALSPIAPAQDAQIRVRADRPGPEVSRHMTGACIEDVNHEIYGGIYSQMLFGESFQEPAATTIEGFSTFGGHWTVQGDVLHAPAGDGPKLLAERKEMTSGEASVQVRFADKRPGLAGLIVKVGEAGVGADRFRGYEISLDPSRQILLLGRHRQNWEPIREVPCEVYVDRWNDLSVTMTETGLEVRVNGRLVTRYEDREHPLPAGAVGLRSWQRETSFRALMIQGDGKAGTYPFREVDPRGAGGVSGMWRVARRGSATGDFSLATDRPFVGTQSQKIRFEKGEGAVGVENRGLNRWGLTFEAGKPYEGYLWMRSDEPVEVHVSAESGDGLEVYAETSIAVKSGDWTRYDFTLKPEGGGVGGRLVVALRKPGSVVLGHAFLQPGEWGRFKGLPVRRDVAQGLIDAGITVMRLGGLMANAEGYRWKNMIGPRDHRAPYKGFWYPQSSNGWGIFDFLNFCEAAGFLPVVDLNLDETPQDLADFVEYANGPAESEWGRKRARDGHPAPYGLKYIELGNEEAVDEAYWKRFKPLAEAIWSKDPNVVLIVGDFEYKRPITDPEKVEGAPRIKSLAAHKKILDLAKEHKREVWFDVHIWNHNPREARGPIAALATFHDALAKLSPGAPFRLCVLEENATNHAVRRAVAHGETIGGLMRMGDRVRIVCAANALQPDGQNDNGWDQGLVFLNPSKAWLQPPAYVSQMISRNSLPRVVEASINGTDDALDATATKSNDGSTLVLLVTNVSDSARTTRIGLEGFTPTRPVARVEELTGPLDATNTASDPTRIQPRRTEWRHSLRDGAASYTFPPHSVTMLRFE